MPKKKTTFNKEFEQLQRIVKEFESSDIDLEESIKKFKKGLTLAKSLKERLKKIENQVEEIKQDFEIEN